MSIQLRGCAAKLGPGSGALLPVSGLRFLGEIQHRYCYVMRKKASHGCLMAKMCEPTWKRDEIGRSAAGVNTVILEIFPHRRRY